ncbi:MAG: hypothetical protein ACR2P7_04345 [bacterium]
MNHQKIEESYAQMMDPEVRRMLRDDPAAAVRELDSRGHHLLNPDEVDEIKVVTSPEGTMHIPLPRIEAGYTMSDGELERIHAGGSMGVSTVGCVSSLGSIGTAGSTFSTISTGGSAGSAGSVQL